MRLVIIPARGGSKRIPRKNIRPFCGKPMLAWSIEAARASECFERIIVSTDDEEIASIARDQGAEVPFMRPTSLATDHIGTIEVIQHAINWCIGQRQGPETVCCLYPTAPFVRGKDLKLGHALLSQQGDGYVVPVTTYPAPIQRALHLSTDQRVEMFDPAHIGTRTQDLTPAYHDAGQFYWGYARAWLAGIPLLSKAATALILPRYRVVDIDNPEDWRQAEIMFEYLARCSS